MMFVSCCDVVSSQHCSMNKLLGNNRNKWENLKTCLAVCIKTNRRNTTLNDKGQLEQLSEYE